jgi:hypothetical protein
MKYHQSKKEKHDDRITVLRKLDDKYDYSNIQYPASHEDINVFEENNKVSMFVYNIDEDNSIREEYRGNVNYISNDIIYLLRIEQEDQSHYVYIKHIQRLLHLNYKSKVKKEIDDKVVKCSNNFCPICHKTVIDDDFKTHVEKCFKFTCSGTVLKLPEEGSTMKFKNFKNTLERPFIVYADIEGTLIKIDDPNLLHRHEANSCCYYFVCTYDNSLNRLETFEGPNCIVDMIESLYKLGTECIEIMKKNCEMKLKKEDYQDFENASKCYLCKGDFDKNNYKVRDHDHRTGKYRGACHTRCNINHFSNRYLPVVFHNLRGYDSHMIIKRSHDIMNKLSDKNIKFSVIPNSNEKFMSFDIGHLRFIDSFQFMASSLESLVENLVDEKATNKYYNFKQSNLCGRCGRYGHNLEDCYAKKHLDGYTISDEDCEFL